MVLVAQPVCREVELRVCSTCKIELKSTLKRNGLCLVYGTVVAATILMASLNLALSSSRVVDKQMGMDKVPDA